MKKFLNLRMLYFTWAERDAMKPTTHNDAHDVGVKPPNTPVTPLGSPRPKGV